jgi:hypothetical protein
MDCACMNCTPLACQTDEYAADIEPIVLGHFAITTQTSTTQKAISCQSINIPAAKIAVERGCDRQPCVPESGTALCLQYTPGSASIGEHQTGICRRQDTRRNDHASKPQNKDDNTNVLCAHLAMFGWPRTERRNASSRRTMSSETPAVLAFLTKNNVLRWR